MTDNMINLGISPDLVKPIVEKQIKAAVTEMFGGADEIINKVVTAMIHQKVDINGKVNSSSYNNTYDWFELVFSKQIKEAVENELKEQMKSMSAAIRKSLIKKLRSEQGANLVADALLRGLEGTFEHSWSSEIDVKLIAPTRD
ncbi:MAG: hypothetical protein K2N48_01450 [Muribaculaceae bacterium]|nr:hypothetical protein [Muribaculaceae bacterium]